MTFRYDPDDNLYHHDMDGNGIICSAVDILPTEFAREVKLAYPLSVICSAVNTTFYYNVGFPTLR